jgi:hypothetical protein
MLQPPDKQEGHWAVDFCASAVDLMIDFWDFFVLVGLRLVWS